MIISGLTLSLPIQRPSPPTKPRTNTINGDTAICIPCLADHLHNHTTMMDTLDRPTNHPQWVNILEIIVEEALLGTCLTLAHRPITAVTTRIPLHPTDPTRIPVAPTPSPTDSTRIPVAHIISKVHIDLALLQVSINMDPLMAAVHLEGLLGLILPGNRSRVKDDQGIKVEEDRDLDLAEGIGNPVVRVHCCLDIRILIFRLDRQHRLELRRFVEDQEDLDRRIIRGGSRMGMGVGLVDLTMVDLGLLEKNGGYWKGPGIACKLSSSALLYLLASSYCSIFTCHYS